MICPSCKTKISEPMAICPICRLDLLPLAKMTELPDYYFNLALKACGDKDWFAAIEALAVIKALNPSDAGALVLLGKIYIELEQINRASTCFTKALKVDARNQEAQNALQWLQDKGCEIPFQVLLG